MAKEPITALMVAPNMKPCIVQLYNEADFLRSAVSLGLMETADVLNVYPLDGQTGILCCKYAALWGGKVNRKIGKRMFAGVFFVVGIHNGTLVSLPPSTLETYRAKLWTPLQPTTEDEFDDLWAVIDALWTDEDNCNPDDSKYIS